MIRYSLEKDNILDNFKKSELMWFMKILYKENQRLKEEINKISKKEVKVRDMLYSIENGTLTRERLMQIEEVLFELEGNNDL